MPRIPSLVALVLCAGAVAQAPADAILDAVPAGAVAPTLALHRPVSLPHAIASFGAARAGDWLYVQGGHVGRTHAHSRDNVVPSLWRLDLRKGTTWEELPDGAAVQGTALVAHGDAVYRIGGMTAHNAPGERGDLHSLASVQRYDPAQRAWTDAAALPEPRSSHDACVVGDRLYVIGGWALAGEGDGAWHATAWAADLSASPLRWEPLPAPPFRRRALAVAPLGHRVAVIGGMDEEGGVTSAVAIYDPRSASWQDGPAFPGHGFGVAAVAVGDALCASGRDGVVFALDSRGTRWERRATLAFPRFFHRLATTPDGGLIAFGGAGHGGHLRTLETVAPRFEQPMLHEWTVAVPSEARNRHGLLLRRDALYVFGGNRRLGQHDFAPEDFVREAFVVDLALMQARAITPLPSARQSMQTAPWGDRDLESVVLGGFAHDGEVARSFADGWRFDFTTETWSELPAALPEPRTQFAFVLDGERLLAVGGTDYDPRRGPTAEDFRYPLDVPALPTDEENAAFASAGVTLPGPRRAFGSAVVDGRLYLIGGMRAGFEVVAGVDVLDLAKRTWTKAPTPPRPRISPEVAALDGRIWVAGGSSRDAHGDFATNRSLDVFDPQTGWRTVLAELPFPTRHVQMRALRDHLLFFSTHFEESGRARVWMLRPPGLGGDGRVDAGGR